ncbi:MAPEG family protein [Pseudomonas asplenii]|uniref:MAPEG family protein n=1 Tax=Pseudomonas asplenii TaxID=53407 RepID=UPI0006B52B52|nr:MAPEG family protein [Pseudomonas fuscovaginae]KPA95137.1 putative membrane protein [Pseudomonas fuscovaginae]
MKLTCELYSFTLVVLATALMWLPYTLARARMQGLASALGNPDPAKPQGPRWAQRARLAHANAIENLAVFAPLVLTAATLGISTPATVMAAKVFLGARLVHFAVYTCGIAGLRTLAFLVGFAATLVFAFTLIGQLG